MTTDLDSKRICVTGGAGFLGRQVVNALRKRNLPNSFIFVPRSTQYDLTQEADVVRLFADLKPEIVIHLAATVGGIGANRAHPGQFFYQNMIMGVHLIEHARRNGVQKFVQTGTVCAYPKMCPVPFREANLWNGYPEETNAPYGIAKRALQVMLDGYKREYGLKSSFLLPVNLFGPFDNFDPATSHVIPALIRKIEDARINGQGHINCWGTGSATREFLYVADAAEAIVRAAERIDEPIPINLGTGKEISIRELVQLIARLCEFDGAIRWDSTYPDGQPRRCLDTSQATQLLSWTASTSLQEGLQMTINWYRAQNGSSGCCPTSLPRSASSVASAKSSSRKTCVNQLEVRLFGMRRSGMHAIANWIGRQAMGPTVLLNNVRRLIGNPFKKCNRAYTYNFAPLQFSLADERNGQLSNKSVLLIGYEDKDITDLPRRFRCRLSRYVGSSQHIVFTLVLRDPYNLFASRMKSSPVTAMNGMYRDWQRRVEQWKSYARAYLHDTNYLKGNVVAISFNQWFIDAKYRQRVADQLGVSYTDAGINEVSDFGGGSSFDGLTMDGRAQEMNVLNRWKHYLHDPNYLRLFDDTELVELARRIFGEMEVAREVALARDEWACWHHK